MAQGARRKVQGKGAKMQDPVGQNKRDSIYLLTPSLTPEIVGWALSSGVLIKFIGCKTGE